MRNKNMYYVLIAMSVIGVLGILGFGFMNILNAGWTKIAGAAQDKANLTSLETTANDVLTTYKGKTVTLTATAA